MTLLYKYRSYSARSLEILIRREIYFASPEKLNDPYDCRLVVGDALAAAIRRARKSKDQALAEAMRRFTALKQVYAKMQRDIEGAGIFSLAKSPKNVLMWSHYAEDHKGFALGFRLSKRFTTHHNDDGIIGAANVYYAEANPFTKFFHEFIPKAKKSDWDAFWTEVLEIGFRAKGASWGYEDEVRVIRKTPGSVAFAPSELREVVFGLNMPMSQQKTLRALLAGSEWRHLRFRKIVRTDGFAVKMVLANAT